MKATRWIAVAFGVLTVLAYLSPFAVTIDSEGAGWLAYFVLVVTWYLIGPALLTSATFCAAISSMLYVRDPQRSTRRKYAIVWSWVVWFILLTAVAIFLFPKPHPYPDVLMVLLFTAVPLITGVSTVLVAVNARDPHSRARVVEH